jgi:DNA-binding beta-propeller fold protein YncE
MPRPGQPRWGSGILWGGFMKGIRNKLGKVAGIPALLLAMAAPALAQSKCTASVASTAPVPSATALAGFRDLLQSPVRIAADNLGRTYVTDSSAGRVFVRDDHGRLTFVKQGLAGPLGIAVNNSSGLIYLGEEKTGSVTVFDAGWRRLGKLGNGNGEFVMPNHIAVDPENGDVYVADSGANQVRVFPFGQSSGYSFGGPGESDGTFNFPTGIFVGTAGEVFVADQNNDRVQVFDRGGQKFLRCFGKKGGMLGGALLGRIQGITGDAQGRVYIADTFQGNVVVFDAQGAKISTIGGFGDGLGELQNPAGLTIDRFNRLLVSSIGNSRVEVFGLDAFYDFSPYRKAAAGLIDEEPLQRQDDRKYVKVFLSVPDVSPKQIAWRTVLANGIPADPDWGAKIADFDKDGVKELGVRFDFGALVATLADGESIIPITGEMEDGTPWGGAMVVRVVPAAGGAQ